MVKPPLTVILLITALLVLSVFVAMAAMLVIRCNTGITVKSENVIVHVEAVMSSREGPTKS